MVINKGHIDAMNNLGLYYNEQKDYTNMLKYYKMSIDEGESNVMINLGFYYEKQKDYPNMIKYYLMAIYNGKNDLIKYLNSYLTNSNNTEHLLLCKKYLDKENTKKLNILIKNHFEIINNLEYELIDNEKIECCICNEESNYLTLCCDHKICFRCYDLIDKCPLCMDAI
jgi:tetratricopeptide (TPR) repeat protein